MIDRLIFASGRAGRYLLAALMTMTVLITLVGGSVWAQGDTPHKINIGDTVTGTLNAETFAQVYTFDGQAGSAVSITATSNARGLSLAVLISDASGALLGKQASLTAAEVALSDVQLKTTGAYYITVLRSTGVQGQASGQYTLKLSAAAVKPATATLKQGMSVSLGWSTIDDMDIEVRDPVGNSVYASNMSAGGGTLSGNTNQDCTNTTRTPSENVSWKKGDVPVGSYEVIVYYTKACTQPAQALNFTLTVTVEGAVQQPLVRGRLNAGEQYVASFIVDAADKVTIKQGGANPQQLSTTPFASKIAAPTDLGTRSTLQGRIDRNNPGDVYSFDGKAKDVVSVAMNAVAGGSLDSMLILLDSRGNVIASNDDASDSTRDSLISGKDLPFDGRYLIVATRFGKDVGGTEGDYTLTVTRPGVTVESPTATPSGPTPTPGGPTLTPSATSVVSTAGLPAGSIEISLVWNNRSDMRLLVRDPDNKSLFSDTTNVLSGGTISQQDNLNCANQTASPLTYAYWPLDRLPVGTFEVQVWMKDQCNEPSLPNYTLTVSVKGKELFHHQDRADATHGLYVTAFNVDGSGNATVGTGGVFTQQASVDIGDITGQLTSAEALVYGRPATGSLDSTTPFVVYAFQARAGDKVRISMRYTRGTLDPFLFLLDSTGTQINSNDDVTAGKDRNSRIDQTIPADGGYVVIATRFGAKFGGTSGGYELSIAPLTQ